MEALLEIVLELFGELLQVVAELLFELGLRSLRAPFGPVPNPYLATVA